jgi:hypothetical protein
MTCKFGIAAVAGVPGGIEAGIVGNYPASGMVVLVETRNLLDLEGSLLLPTLAQT